MDTLKLIENTGERFAKLWARMDETRKRIYMEKYQLVDSQGKPIENVVSVTMNDAAVFVNVIVSALLTSKWQTVIEGNIPSKQQRILEQFIDDALAQADEVLQDRREPGLLPFWCNHVTHRSFIGARVLLQQGEEGHYPELLPVDMRYVTYEGQDWVGAKTYRSSGEIKRDYPDTYVKDNQADIECVDWWDGEKEEVWIDKKMTKTNKHRIGYSPFVIASPSSGFMLRDKGYLEHEAEDVLFLDRFLYDEWNRTVSIEQTMNMKLILPPYIKENQDMGGPPSDYPDKPGAVTDILKGEPYTLLAQQDINQAHRMASQNILRAIQQGGVNNIDLGNVSLGVSAVWITEQSEIRSKILEPRLQCLINAKAQVARMLIDQANKAGLSNSLGKSGLRRDYSAQALGDPTKYAISFKLMSRSKKQEIANLAMAQAARGTVSQISILRDILQHEDPEGEMARLDAEKAEQADPSLFFLRKACSLVDEAEQLHGVEKEQKLLESRIMTKRGVALLLQRQGESQIEAPKGNSNALIPLLGQSGMKGGNGASEVTSEAEKA